MLSAVAYVLKSFPEPSETFIADEALSLRAAGVKPHILYMEDGSRAVTHAAARALLERPQDFFKFGSGGYPQMLLCLLWLLLHKPRRTLATLALAWRDESRWCYWPALVAAVWCLRRRIQWLHAHFVDKNCLYARAVSDWSGIPFGVTGHRYDILEDPLNARVAQRLLHRADVIVTISEFNRGHIAAKYGVDPAAIHIVHCGIDLTRFAFAPRPVRAATRPVRLLNVGRLVAIKGQDVLLAALAIVRSRGVSCTLDIIGAGPLDAELKRQAAEAGLMQTVQFHGAQDAAFVRSSLVNADVFVLPSRSEGLPVACIEAMAVGTPVIATRIFGIPELIDHRISGFLVAADDSVALADAICWVHQSAETLDAVCAAARHKVEAEFERTDCTRQLLGIWSKKVAGWNA